VTIYVVREGKLVEKRSRPREKSRLATPMISRLEPYESPIDGTEITSWGQRERELRDNDAYDPRDVTAPYPRSIGRKKSPDERPERPDEPDLPFWTDPIP
jgi:hypothetical protein